MYTVYKMHNTTTYVILIDMNGDDCLYLHTKTINISDRVSWKIKKISKKMYNYNKKYLDEFCTLDIDEEAIAKALLIDAKTVVV